MPDLWGINEGETKCREVETEGTTLTPRYNGRAADGQLLEEFWRSQHHALG